MSAGMNPTSHWPPPTDRTAVWVWRHPLPIGVAGRCIGRTDVRVDPRRSKRLARRIQAVARREGLGRVVHSSPLQRCANVGRWLRRWGWKHVVDVDLLELDFGTWDGLPWAHVPHAEVDAWCAAFATHAPGGGEPLARLLQRAAAWVPNAGTGPQTGTVMVVGHAGWMLARRWVQTHGPGVWPQAADWPQAPGHGQCWCL